MNWSEACLQRCSVAYKCVPSRLSACLPALTHTHPRTFSISYLHSLSLSFSQSLFLYANRSVGLGFFCLVLLWKQTDRHTPTREKKENLAIRSLLCGRFHLEYKKFRIHLLMLFHLQMGKNRLLWFRLKKNEIWFFFLAVRVKGNLKRDEGREMDRKWAS